MAILGVIADDFTGAGDIASFLVKGGMKTVMLTDFTENISRIQDGPYDGQLENADAVVIALKTRTQETASAVRDSLSAVRFMKNCGCTHFYIKYCSTFDSTEKGNIGPICDAVMDELDCRQAIICPALPVNGRCVKDGKLYVNGVLLAESPMKDHPLTPMHESDLVLLMTPQSRYPSRKIGSIKNTDQRVDFTVLSEKEYLIPDCVDDGDLENIAKVFGRDTLLTGGSGLAEHLGKVLLPGTRKGLEEKSEYRKRCNDGFTFLLAGSCSKATRSQIEHYEQNNGVSIHLQVEKISDGSLNLDRLAGEIIEKLKTGNVLVYTSDSPDHTRLIMEKDPLISSEIEQIMGTLARKIKNEGCKKIVVAGGETSGAVTKALEIHSVKIGESIAPGVPVMSPFGENGLKLVLKSGNFGQADFFNRAINIL